ncbi:hypothetical protein PoB_003119800 [Plakobranchus ocellatus]|uniref:Uncharacterized protein n=1 Tax=Plakobranchus ocellatus TaxID=259542 RepID=A0AAV4ADR9_9GAST|nr:hypothetical protein PoB_003119800 [Plakobranchus ocellatus]
MEPVHNKVISSFQALCQARAPESGLEPTTAGSQQISGWASYPLSHQHPTDLKAADKRCETCSQNWTSLKTEYKRQATENGSSTV